MVAVIGPTNPYHPLNYTCFNGKEYPTNNPDFALDADISGIGVTISFLLTAIGTFAFVLYGFSRNLLMGPGPPHRSDQLAFTWLRWLIDGLIGIMPKWIARHVIRSTPLATGENLEREKRVFSTAVQMMGDQQLVIGLAYLYGGLSSPCTLSLYSLKNLAAISWLSSVVHITTLVAVSRSSYSPQSKKARFFRVSLTIIMILTTMAITVAFAMAQFIEGTSQISKSVLSILMGLRFELDLSVVPFTLFLLFGLWLSAFYFSKLWSNTWPGRPGLFSFLPEFRFRLLARCYGVRIPKGLSYRRLRRLSDFTEWISYQDSIRDKTEQQTDKEQMLTVTRLSKLQMLKAPLPDENKPAISHEIFLLFFFLVQSTTRFVLSWVQFLGYSFGGFTFEWEAMDWGTGQIIPIVMLLSSFFTWLSMSENQAPDGSAEREHTDSPRFESQSPFTASPAHHQRPRPISRNDTETTLTDEPILLDPALSPKPSPKPSKDTHQLYLTPQTFYTFSSRITLNKIRIILHLLLTIFTSVIQVIVSGEVFDVFSGIAHLTMLSLALFAFTLALGRSVFRFVGSVRKDIVILRRNRQRSRRQRGEGDGEECMRGGDDGVVRVAAGQIRGEDDAELKWGAKAARTRLEDRLVQVREDRAMLWEAEMEVRRGVVILDAEMEFLRFPYALGSRDEPSCQDVRGNEMEKKDPGLVQDLKGKTRRESSGCEKGKTEGD